MVNKFRNNLGFHFGGETPKTWMTEAIAAMQVSSVLQFIISNPQSYAFPNRNHIKNIVSLMGGGLRPVVHCPYLVTLTRVQDEQMLKYTISYVIDFYKQLADFTDKIVPFVLHTGKPPHDDLVGIPTKDTMKSSLNLLSVGLDKNGVKNDCVCVETDASCYNPGTRLPLIARALEELGNQRFGITLDSEHSFASGYDIGRVITPEVWKWIKVLHLNAIPPEVVFGRGLDRHSHTKIRDCSQGQPYIHCFEEAIRRDLPIILERREREIVLDDIEYLSMLYKEGVV